MRTASRIFNYIQIVRARPEEDKKRAVMVWTITLTSLIFIIWSVSFGLSVANNQAEEIRLRNEAVLLAKTQAVVAPKKSWGTKLNELVVGGADSVAEGFWTVGSWLHK